MALAAPPASPDDARGSLALYCATECGELSLADFALRARLPLTAARPVVVLSDVTDTWPRPDAERLAGWGEGDVTGMAEAGEIVLLQWAVPLEEGAPRLSSLATAAAAAATWVEDADTGRLLDAARTGQLAAAAGAAEPDIAKLIVVEVHDADAGLLTLATTGLRRLGLPELVDSDVPRTEIGTRAARLNAIAQAVYEEGLDSSVDVDSARFASASARQAACGLTGTATLELLHGRSIVPGPGPKALLVDFAGAFGSCGDTPTAPSASATAADSAPAGAVARPSDGPPPPAPPPADSLQAVQAAALSRLGGPVHDAFVAGLPAGDRLMVKAPFQSPRGGVAWLWLQVDTWSADGVLAGPLLSEPPAGFDLQLGATVQAPLDLVFDYLWQRADGSTEGNTTQRFL